MTEREVFERIVAAYQTYEAFGDALYRTAVVWARRDGPVVDGLSDPFVVWTVTADSSGTVGEVCGCASEQAARTLANDWVGSEREVPVDQVPYSALNWAFSAVTGTSLR